MENKNYFYYPATDLEPIDYLVEHSEWLDGGWLYPGKQILVVEKNIIIDILTKEEFKKKYGK